MQTHLPPKPKRAQHGRPPRTKRARLRNKRARLRTKRARLRTKRGLVAWSKFSRNSPATRKPTTLVVVVVVVVVVEQPRATVEDPGDITETTRQCRRHLAAHQTTLVVVVVEQPRATVEDPGDITETK